MTTGELLTTIGLIVAGYVVGSVPFGVIVCRLGFGVDILDHGSQRSGSTNVLRTVGPGAAALVLLADFLKGLVPALVARLLVGHLPVAPVMVALAALLGANWSVFLRFRGGRGVATAWGAMMALVPIAAVIGVPLGIGTVIVIRYASLGSIFGAIGFLVGSIAFYALGMGVNGYLLFMVAAINVLIVFRHVDNLQRLISGTERRLDPWPEMIRSRTSHSQDSGD